jgi:microcystin-dependent protein
MPLEPYIGEIYMFAGTFAPKNFALCNGALIAIAQNTALFSILGTTYGGDGIHTFALPDLRGRFPMHSGQGLGLSNRVLGEQSGVENVTLLTSNMPAHNHLIVAQKTGGDTASPDGKLIAADGAGNALGFGGTANGTLSPTALSVTGSSLPHENMPPYLCVNFIICLYGEFPSRD